ncbi:MAG: hypothetical protein H6807_14425 [Planctomycetes bacterium]|nr:hypothetical protein [Planctomycetota bacterium]
MTINPEGSGEGRNLDAGMLAVLHRLMAADRDIAQAHASLDRRPKELDLKRREVATQEAAVRTATDTVKVAQKRIDRKSLESDALEADVKKLEGQLFSLKTNDEFEAMKHQIAQRREKDDLIQTEVLELLEALETLKADEAGEKDKLRALQANLAKAEERVRAELAVAETEVMAKEEARQALRDQLSEDLRALYDVAHERRGSGVARLVDQVCKGCDTQVTMNVLGAVMARKLTRCPHCQRILVLES